MGSCIAVETNEGKDAAGWKERLIQGTRRRERARNIGAEHAGVILRDARVTGGRRGTHAANAGHMPHGRTSAAPRRHYTRRYPRDEARAFFMLHPFFRQ